jgi:hypothetical protein
MPVDPYKLPISFTKETLEAVDAMAAERAEPGKRADRSATVRALITAEVKRKEKSSKKSRSTC